MMVDRDGSLTQLMTFDRIAWHAGKCWWQGRTRLNRFSVGIELVKAGELKPSGNQYVSWFGGRDKKDEVIEAVHRNKTEPTFWHTYTQEQIEARFEVCHVLKLNYPLVLILGHEEIAPERKIDPGPAFPLDRLKDYIIVGRDDKENSDSNGLLAASSQSKNDRLPGCVYCFTICDFP